LGKNPETPADSLAKSNEPEIVSEPEVSEVAEKAEPEVEVDVGLIAEADEVMNEAIEDAVDVSGKEVAAAEVEPVAAESEVTIEESVESEPETELIAEADVVMNEVESAEGLETESQVDLEESREIEAEEVIEEAPAETKKETEALAEVITENKGTPDAVVATESASTEPLEEEPTPEGMMVSESGQRIPFMEPAMRDYTNRPKPDFNTIENSSMRRMIKRMRAEDIGRMAVLKNMKNQWVDEGKTQKALVEIKENKRNQEVLANLVEPVAREEKIRDPFDLNDTRTREGVHYQLSFKLASPNVSETVQESMSAEQAMTFAMPEFEISSDHFQNLADARAEMRYYTQRGFHNVWLVAYLNGEQVMLSDVQNIPFVD
jgi:hypothetical protein